MLAPASAQADVPRRAAAQSGCRPTPHSACPVREQRGAAQVVSQSFPAGSCADDVALKARDDLLGHGLAGGLLFAGRLASRVSKDYRLDP
jgi:hypothetical protein